MLRLIFCSTALILLGCSTAVADDIRRVVTGLDDNNHSVVIFDSPMPLRVRPVRNRFDQSVDHRQLSTELIHGGHRWPTDRRITAR